jgi:hypothetical protein
MKPQAAGKTSPALYRCVTTSVHGRCPAPTTITKRRVEDYAVEQFLAALEDVAFVAEEDAAVDAEERRRLVGEAAAAERSYRGALTNTALRAKIGDADHDQMVASLYDAWTQTVARIDDLAPRPAVHAVPDGITLRELIGQLRAENRNEELRGLLGEGIEAVFVRPAASKRRNEPVGDRVRVVLRGHERLELPRRGRRFEPRPYVW